MELRLYTFCNFYLSQIQGGIQSAHLVHELFVKYQHSKPQLLWDWASDHKTMIVLNGGAAGDLHERRLQLFNNISNIEEEVGIKTIPWASFHEDKNSLDGAITCVGLVLPESIFNAQEAIGGYSFSDETRERFYPTGSATANLIDDLKSCRLF